MKCNNCSHDMTNVFYEDSDGYFNNGIHIENGRKHKLVGDIVYCPNCGNLQVDIDKDESGK